MISDIASTEVENEKNKTIKLATKNTFADFKTRKMIQKHKTHSISIKMIWQLLSEK